MPDLIQLYRDMAAITKPICDAGCEQFAGNPLRCCEKLYCEKARQFAREKYGIELVVTGHGTVPFMGPEGCTIEPYLRPWCTLHACPINYGSRPKVSSETEKKYYDLRRVIFSEAEAHGKTPIT